MRRMQPNNRSSRFDWNFILQLSTGIGVPLGIAVAGWLIAQSVENAKLDAEYLRLALSILTNGEVTVDASNDLSSKQQENAQKQKTDDPQKLILKKWATNVLQAKSPVPISPEEAKAFYEGGIKELNLVKTSEDVPGYGSYVIGSALGKSGIAKLKSHVDSKTQNCVSTGLGRLDDAALFVSLPYVLSLMKDATIMQSENKKKGNGNKSFKGLQPLE